MNKIKKMNCSFPGFSEMGVLLILDLKRSRQNFTFFHDWIEYK